VFAAGDLSETRWRGFVQAEHHTGTTTMTNHAGEEVTVCAATVADILPGFHVAAFAVTDPRDAQRQPPLAVRSHPAAQAGFG
jgi:hypothetical protein